MGLFKNKHKDEAEDFILDFAPAAEEKEEFDPKPEEFEAVEPILDEEFELPSWENRKKVKAPHAMTINEILGTVDSEGENSLEGGIKPRQQINADELIDETSKIEVSEETVSEAKEELSKTETNEDFHINAKSLAGDPKNDEFEQETNELIARLKSKKAENATSSEIEKTAQAEIKTEVPSIPEIKIVDPISPVIPETNADSPISTPVIHEAKAENPTPPAKKETTLSPAAQVLYDRMMAQRAKRQLAGEGAPSKDAEPELDVATNINFAHKTPKAHIDAEPLDTDIMPVYENMTKESFENEERLADSIFSSLKDTLKEENPLIRKKQVEGESLLSKCKNYVAPSTEISEDSIDNIIHNAEQGARERLSNLYEVHDAEPIRNTSSFEFAALIKNSDPENKSVSVPVKLIDETSDKAVISSHTGEIKNFQFSFADNSEETEISSSTKVIDLNLNSAPHHADTAKIEAIRMHLDAMANADTTAEIPLPNVKFTGSDETGVPDDIAHKEIPQMEDYSSVQDKAGIRTDLFSKKVSLIARLLSTSILFAASLLLNLVFKSSVLEASPMGFAIINLAVLAISMAINHNVLKGIGSLLGGSPDMDSPCALAVASTFAWSIVAMLGSNSDIPVLAPVAIMALLFNTLGKLSILSRISRGFDIIANSNPKRAINFVEDKLDAAIMANGAVIGEALVAKGQETKNIRDFLKNSYTEDLYERKLKPIILTTLIVAVLFGVAGFIAIGTLSGAMTGLCAATLIACPPTVLLACNMPLNSAQKRLTEYDAMIAGHAAAEAIANANAVAFSASELFPEGTVKLYNMHVLNKGAVDKYLTAAAAVLGEAGSPLCPIFKEMLEDSKEPLPKADSIKFESQMGVSGWIGEHRVFVGNRTLMEGHNIKVPSLELDKKILRSGYFPVYLAFDQQLCALFIVGYEADETITYELRRLCSTGVTMLVQTNDPNVTENMLCDYFGLYPDSIKILSPSGVSALKKGTAFKESISAPASFSGGICGLLATITSAINIKSCAKTLFIINMILAIIGLAAGGYMIVSGLGASLGIAILVYQLATTTLTGIISSLKQP